MVLVHWQLPKGPSATERKCMRHIPIPPAMAAARRLVALALAGSAAAGAVEERDLAVLPAAGTSYRGFAYVSLSDPRLAPYEAAVDCGYRSGAIPSISRHDGPASSTT